VDAAAAAGAEVVTGGSNGGNGTGYFYAPTVVTGAPAETDLLRRQFGPAPLSVKISTPTTRAAGRAMSGSTTR
jgi:acyl-CoA reductase-like NAD-dependent aldehyde dehydrogenase